MDRVLGLSMTAQVLRWVLVDGATGDGATVERGALDIADVDAFDAEDLVDALLDAGVVHSIGLTWTPDADAAAIKVYQAVAVLGGGVPVAAFTDVEATETLAGGIADVAGYGFLVVCTVEPDATVVATVSAPHVTAQRIEPTDPVPLIDQVSAAVRGARPSPDAIFILGSGDTTPLASALQDTTSRPVLTATEAEFALARGAAMASAQARIAPAAPAGTPRVSPVGALASVLAAAATVLVVALSLAVVPHRTADPQPQHSQASAHSVRPAPTAHAAAPPAAPGSPPAAPAAPPAAGAPAAAPAPPAPPAEQYQQMQGEPVYVPPPPPPRLRDRIIQKIPGLNRLH